MCYATLNFKRENTSEDFSFVVELVDDDCVGHFKAGANASKFFKIEYLDFDEILIKI